MFGNTKSKLEDSRIILDQFKATNDALTFRSLFNSFLSASRAITYALQKDGKSLPGFSEWYKTKQEEMRKDDLLRFVHEARTEDFHEGKRRLRFAHFQKFFDGKGETPPSPNARIAFGAEGPLWIVAKGTPEERRIPIKKGGEWITQVSITGPPTTHLGFHLERNDPMTICELALDYFTKLVYEAKTKFAPNIQVSPL